MTKKYSFRFVICVSILFFFICCLTSIVLLRCRAAQAKEAKKNDRQVILILLDQITWQDLRQAHSPFISKLIKQGSVANMSPRTVSPVTSIGRGYLTIGAGNRADTTFFEQEAYNLNEPYETSTAEQAFRRRTGKSTDDYRIVHLGAFSLTQRNLELPYDTKVGLLGDKLREAGLKTAVIGNADVSLSYREGTIHREAAMIAMDRYGRINYGDVGKDLLEENKNSPFGLQTNTNKLFRDWQEIKNKANFVVIDFGDTTRADLYSSFSDEGQTNKQKKIALERADQFIKKVYQNTNPNNSLVIITSPSSPSLPPTQQLEPMIMAGEGIKEGGYLSSGSTLREGLVVNVDIAPTVLDFLKVSTSFDFPGRKIISQPSGKQNRISSLADLNDESVAAELIKPTYIITFIIWQILVFLASLTVLLLRRKMPKYFYGVLSTATLSVMLIPFTSFLLPVFIKLRPDKLVLFGATAVGLIIISTFLVSILKRDPFDSLIVVSLATFVLLAVNLISGAKLNVNTAFGYSPIIAGRFYGLGNEAMALLIACTLLGSTVAFEQFKVDKTVWKLVLGAFFVLTVIIIGLPTLGAQVGGAFTGVAAFGVTLLLVFRERVKARDIAIVLVAMIIFLALFVAFDMFRPSQLETHVGRSVEIIKAGGFSSFSEIVRRKVAANLRILRYSSWSYLFLAILGLLVAVRFKPRGEFEKILSRHPYLSYAITGAIVGGIVGFLTEDSGIAIPAIIASYFTAAIFYLMLQQKINLE